ncbi:response regulator [Rhodobacter lacus]|uniref:Response regulator n=1 Tax=Rhodobacter lacus TaxID=1641972 RepID=A0ABW5ABM7_9RHOB
MPDGLNKIMLVEDDAQIAFMTVMALEDLGGFEVMHCDNGQAALDNFDAFAPQIVLMDVMMPGIDGPETLKALRINPLARTVPVVFMTAKVQPHQQQGYFDLGAVGVIAKPFDPMTLSDRVVGLWQAAQAS